MEIKSLSELVFARQKYDAICAKAVKGSATQQDKTRGKELLMAIQKAERNNRSWRK
jgi:hypothetical protein